MGNCMKHSVLNFSAVAKMVASLALTGILAGCGGGGGGGGTTVASTFTVGGKVSGLLTGNSVVLLDNGGNAITVGSNVAFTFSSAVTNAAGYAVTVKTQPAGQTCAVTNGSGTIAGVNVTNVAVVCSDNTYNVAVTVTGLLATTSVVLQDNGADNLTIAANGTVNFNTPVASGSRYAVAVLTQPAGQNCTVAGGSGTIVAANVSVSVACSKATTTRYAISADYFGATVSTYSVDAATGRVKLIGTTADDRSPTGVAVHPSGQFVYVANFGRGNISQFRLGADGTLLPLTPALVAIGTTGAPINMTIDPSGRNAYVVNSNSTGADGLGVYQYAIGPDGGLVPMAVPTVATGLNPSFIAVDPTGRYAYVTNVGDGTISQYAVGANGDLLPLSPATVASGPRDLMIAIDSRGKFAYTANSLSTGVDGKGVSQYAIGSGGALMPLAAPNVAAGLHPQSVALDPSGRFAYVANFGDNNVSQYSVTADGSLAAMATPTVAAGTAPISITVDANGRFAYATNYCNVTCGGISQFSIDSAGALQPLSPGFFAAHNTPVLLALATGNAAVTTSTAYAYVMTVAHTTAGATSPVGANGSVNQYPVGSDGTLQQPTTLLLGADVYPLGMVVNPTAPYAYIVDNAAGSVLQYSIGAAGALTPLTVPSVAVAAGAYAIAVDPAGQFVYVTADNLGVYEYKVLADGSLSLLGNVILSIVSRSIQVDPSGRFLYVSDAGGSVWQFSIAGSGAIAALSAPSVVPGFLPLSLCIAPSAVNLYVTTFQNDAIAQYAIAADGTLSPLAPASVSTPNSFPSGVAIDPTGNYVYASSVQANNQIFQFQVGAGGALSPLSPASVSVAPGNYPEFLLVDPTGKNVYTANSSSKDISLFHIGTGGVLTAASPAPQPIGAIPTGMVFTATRQ
jgi:6-phosphogluconolactonase (cycloisomerase 2 family)